MPDWIYGFFMAWGMFLAIPCPKKIWRGTAQRKMLSCLPLVGCIVGALWVLCFVAAKYLPKPLGSAILAAEPWLATGFIHLDGYMDVCDAVLSRRDLETRRSILKDSHCGAFSVICMVLLAMGQWSAFLSMDDASLHSSLLGLTLIPVSSRSCAALAVLTLRPLGSSQYSDMKRGGVAVWFPALCLVVSTVLPIVLGMGFAPLSAALGYGLAVWYGFVQLDGMSGDVSGFALSIGELCGVVVLAVWR